MICSLFPPSLQLGHLSVNLLLFLLLMLLLLLLLLLWEMKSRFRIPLVFRTQPSLLEKMAPCIGNTYKWRLVIAPEDREKEACFNNEKRLGSLRKQQPSGGGGSGRSPPALPFLSPSQLLPQAHHHPVTFEGTQRVDCDWPTTILYNRPKRLE